jgi:hypothetical protein
MHLRSMIFSENRFPLFGIMLYRFYIHPAEVELA